MSATRFAPSPTGAAHPGTLLSALLVWLEARSTGAKALLRLENLDFTRSKATWQDEMIEALHWLGLDWDEVLIQSQDLSRYHDTLDQLANAGRLYECTCTRRDLQQLPLAADGSTVYPNRCRSRVLTSSQWRATSHAVRCRLDDGRIEVFDQSGSDLSQSPALAMGDPVVVRRDKVISYQLAVVVDDIASRITSVVRGKDIAPSTATQVALIKLLAAQPPRYRHHFLLLAESSRSEKLAKLHGSIPLPLVREHYTAPSLLGAIAHAAGLAATTAPTSAQELLRDFSWHKVTRNDLVCSFDGLLHFSAAPE